MENNENTKSAGTETVQELKGFKINASINFELKFGEQGVEMTYEPKTSANALVALLISHELATNAKNNMNANIELIKNDKQIMDRLNWAGKTIKGLDVFIHPFMQQVIEENTMPNLTPVDPTEEQKRQMEAALKSSPAEIESKTTIQDNPIEL